MQGLRPLHFLPWQECASQVRHGLTILYSSETWQLGRLALGRGSGRAGRRAAPRQVALTTGLLVSLVLSFLLWWWTRK